MPDRFAAVAQWVDAVFLFALVVFASAVSAALLLRDLARSLARRRIRRFLREGRRS